MDPGGVQPTTHLIKFKSERFRTEIRKKEIDKFLQEKRIKLHESVSNENDLRGVKLETQKPFNELYSGSRANLQPFDASKKTIENSKQIDLLFQKLIKQTKDFYKTLDFLNLQETLSSIRIQISVGGSENKVEILHKEGILDILAEVLKSKYQELNKLQREASWCMCNIFGSAYLFEESYLDSTGILNSLVELLESTFLDNVDNALFALSNLAANNPNSREKIINHPSFLTNLNRFYSLEMSLHENILKDIVWLISNLCKDCKEGVQSFDKIVQFIPLLFSLIINIKNDNPTNQEILLFSFTGLSRVIIFNQGLKVFQDFFNEDFAQKALILCYGGDAKFKMHILNVVGVLISEKNEFAEVFVKYSLIQLLSLTLDMPEIPIKTLTLWILGNLCACSPEIYNLVYLNNNFVQRIKLLTFSGNYKVRSDSMFVLTNLIRNSSSEQIGVFNNKETIEILISVFDFDYSEGICQVLETFYHMLDILTKDERVDSRSLYVMLEKHNFISILDTLQRHPDQKVYDSCLKIINKFYDYEQM